MIGSAAFGTMSGSAIANVVSTGVFKLQPGMSVVIDNALAPAFSFTPSPGNT